MALLAHFRIQAYPIYNHISKFPERLSMRKDGCRSAILLFEILNEILDMKTEFLLYLQILMPAR